MKVLKLSSALLLLGHADASPASAGDLQRAKTKKPRDAYRGDDQTVMSQVLNQHIKKAEKQTLPCADWSTADLQAFMSVVGEHREDVLQEVYRAATDRRSLKATTLEDHKGEWAKLNHIVGNHPHLYDSQQEAHCREAVMWWVHHLHEEKREHLRSSNLTVPLLPESPKKACGRGEGHEEAHVCLFINEKNSCEIGRAHV